MDEQTRGLTKNPHHLLYAENYPGEDAELYDLGLGHYVVRVTGPDKVLMDTDYMPYNEFIGLHHLYIRFWTDKASGDSLTVEYKALDDDGVEYSLATVDVEDTNTIYYGDMGTGNFTAGLSHRIILKSHTSVDETEYVGVDYVKIEPESPWPVRANQIGVSKLLTDDVPYFWIMDAGSVSVTGDNSTWHYSTTVTPTGFQPNAAYIVATVTEKYFHANVENKTNTTFDLRVAHHNETNWTGTKYVNYIIMQINTPTAL